MKRALLFLSSILLSTSTPAQSEPTVREIFDVEINDVFHYSSSLSGQGQNANRVTILDKRYSANGNTLHITEFHDSYQVGFVPGNPISFNTDTIRKIYYNLDSVMSQRLTGFYLDTFSVPYQSYCDSSVYGYTFLDSSWFEPNTAVRLYAKGLGLLFERAQYGGCSNPYIYKSLIYYNTVDGRQCGTPDFTSLEANSNLENQKSFMIFPNPATEFVHISNHIEQSALLIISNLKGEIVLEKQLKPKTNYLDLSHLTPSIYSVKIIHQNEIFNSKLMIQ